VDPSPPIFGFNAAREGLVREVVERIVESAQDPLFYLNDAAYHETKRLEAARGPERREASARGVAAPRARIGRMSDRRAPREAPRADRALRRGTSRATSNPRVYKVSTRLLPPLVTGAARAAQLAQARSELSASRLRSRQREGRGPAREAPEARRRRARAVFVPTHLSNMDSIVFGYALDAAGCRPRPTAPGRTCSRTRSSRSSCTTSARTASIGACGTTLYKDVLKTYSCVLLERGYHSLFFPGRHPLALRRHRAAAQARPRRQRLEAYARTADRRPRAARLLRPLDHQLPDHPRGRDAHRRLPLGGGQGPLHHRGRRVDALRPLLLVRAQALRHARRRRDPLRRADRPVRQRRRRQG
jgi:hypothetical protein